MSIFEDFVNAELPRRPSADIPSGGNFGAGQILVTTGVGMKTAPQSLEELSNSNIAVYNATGAIISAETIVEVSGDHSAGEIPSIKAIDDAENDTSIGMVVNTSATVSNWIGSEVVSLDDVRKSTAGNTYIVTTAGTTDGSEPTWDTAIGNTTADNDVTWTRIEDLGIKNNQAGNVFAKGRMTLTSLDLSGASIGQRIYADDNGKLSLTESNTRVGQVLDTSTNIAWINIQEKGATAQSGINGAIFITDIVPTGAGNVYTKQYEDGIVLTSVNSDVDLVTVTVRAERGNTHYIPQATVNGVAVTGMALVNANDDYYEGTADIDMNSLIEISAIHEDGATDTCVFVKDAAPEIQTLVFTGSYPGTQSELKEDDVVSFQVTTDIDVVEVQIINDNAGAGKGQTHTGLTAGKSHTLTMNVKDQGNTVSDRPIFVRVKTAAGSWSDIIASNKDGGTTDLVDIVKLNNLKPSVSIGAVTYPASQSAIKATEQATVANTVTDYTTITYSSLNGSSGTPELTITDANVYNSTKTVERLTGDYNISNDNLKITAHRAENDSTTTATKVVQIADADPVIDISSPTRLRSGGSLGTSAQNHSITIASDQEITAPTLDADKGVWQGGAFTGGPTSYSRNLQINDAVVKGAGVFSNLSVTNLANKTISVINSGSAYTVGGFVKRTMTIAAWTNRDGDIGTNVVDTAKLVCTNLGVNKTSTYKSTIGDELERFTITGSDDSTTPNATGSWWYNCDMPNAQSNTSGTMKVEIEETI